MTKQQRDQRAAEHCEAMRARADTVSHLLGEPIEAEDDEVPGEIMPESDAEWLARQERERQAHREKCAEMARVIESRHPRSAKFTYLCRQLRKGCATPVEVSFASILVEEAS